MLAGTQCGDTTQISEQLALPLGLYLLQHSREMQSLKGWQTPDQDLGA